MLFTLRKRKYLQLLFCVLRNYSNFSEPGHSRKRRDIDNQQFPYSSSSDQSEVQIIRNITENGYWFSFNFTVYGKTELRISNLHHYTEYKINLTVCRAIETKEDANTSCSIPYERSKSTKQKGNATLARDCYNYLKFSEGADDIKKVEVIRNQTSQAITFTWEDPPDPNGAILTYSLYIQAENVGMVSPLVTKITLLLFFLVLGIEWNLYKPP